MGKILTSVVMAATLFAACGNALALYDVSGGIPTWGITPFSDWTASAGIARVPGGSGPQYQNDWSPVAYPGIGHVPSPGMPSGEPYDLEQMYWTIDGVGTPAGKQLKVLLITSIGPNGNVYGGTVHDLGSLFVRVGQTGPVYGFNAGPNGYAHAGHDANYHYGSYTSVPATLYNIDDALDVTAVSGPYSYNYPPYQDMLSPWAVNVNHATAVSAAVGLTEEAFNFGGTEGNTYAYEWSIKLSDIGLGALTADDLGLFGFHVTIECGNDMIDLVGQGGRPPVPEPLTFLAVGTGLVALGRYVRGRLIA